jgi:hypothetical protein
VVEVDDLLGLSEKVVLADETQEEVAVEVETAQ